MKKTTFFLLLLLLACWSLASCVSLKKYRLLEEDYQECGKYQRSYEQWKRIDDCEKADRERMKKEEVEDE